MEFKKILIVAGEVSGDAHAAEMVKELQQLNKHLSFFGIGGEALKKLCMTLFYHVEQMAFLGIGEIIKHLPFIKKVNKNLLMWAANEKPDCAILVDYPGFNLRLAKSLKKLNIPVIYYISPQLWAWGKSRVKKIKKYVDKMIVLFPFEKKFYAEYGISADFAGHPLVDKHHSFLGSIKQKSNPTIIKIGLLPGSRKQEVNSLLPRMIETARKLLKHNAIHHAEIIKVQHLNTDLYESLLKQTDSEITIIQKPLNECLPNYDAVMVASGTATLECGYYGVPMLIVYHVNPLTYFLGKRLVKLKNIGLVNIVAEKQVASELIQHDFTVGKAYTEMLRILDPKSNSEIRSELKVVIEKLGKPGAAKRAAECVLGFLNSV